MKSSAKLVGGVAFILAGAGVVAGVGRLNEMLFYEAGRSGLRPNQLFFFLNALLFLLTALIFVAGFSLVPARRTVRYVSLVCVLIGCVLFTWSGMRASVKNGAFLESLCQGFADRLHSQMSNEQMLAYFRNVLSTNISSGMADAHSSPFANIAPKARLTISTWGEGTNAEVMALGRT